MPAMYALPLIVMNGSPPRASWPCILLHPQRSMALTLRAPSAYDPADDGAADRVRALPQHHPRRGFLVGELLLCRAGMTIEQAKRLAIIDAVFFASALATLATGLLRLFFYAKGISFYTGNPVFWTKMALYVIIATLSITPTRTFLRWKRAATARGAAPAGGEIAAARRLIHIELG